MCGWETERDQHCIFKLMQKFRHHLKSLLFLSVSSAFALLQGLAYVEVVVGGSGEDDDDDDNVDGDDDDDASIL